MENKRQSIGRGEVGAAVRGDDQGSRPPRGNGNYPVVTLRDPRRELPKDGEEVWVVVQGVFGEGKFFTGWDEFEAWDVGYWAKK